jgi:uncharacterized protein (TIGR02118 family)
MPKIRLTIGYHQPPDDEAFLAHYRDVHAPLSLAVPGVESFEWSKVIGTPTGEKPRYFVLAELTYATMETLISSTQSPEGAVAAADAAAFATNGFDVFVSEIVES